MDGEHYWDAWTSLMDNNEFFFDGKEIILFQNGDLFAMFHKERDKAIEELKEQYPEYEDLIDEIFEELMLF
jgi:hypothetical protein